MHISDWSSDVCSSDLGDPRKGMVAHAVGDRRLADPRDGRADADSHRCGRRCRRQRGNEGMGMVGCAIDAERLGALVRVVKARVAPDPAELRLACGAPGSVFGRDRKSTRLTPVTNAHLVCRLLLEKK